MSILRKTGVAIIVSTLAGRNWFCSGEEDEEIRLPPAVEKTAREVSKGATIKGFSQETENGKSTYEIEMVVDGHTKDVALDASGAVSEVEEEGREEQNAVKIRYRQDSHSAALDLLRLASPRCTFHQATTLR